jgi:hypothetical protein
MSSFLTLHRFAYGIRARDAITVHSHDSATTKSKRSRAMINHANDAR